MRAGTEAIVAAAAAVALGLGLPAAARAQPSASGAATLQFDKGRALMKEKKYAEACTAFEQSQKLDPQIGTLYNLGLCYAQLGKTASAWNALREVGQRDTNGSRKQEANRRAKDLEKRLPKLLLELDPVPPGLAVKMNGVDVTAFVGADSPVDPAEYKLMATAPGHAAWEATVKIPSGGKTTTIAIELLPSSSPEKEPIRPDLKRPPPAGGGEVRTDPAPRPPAKSAMPTRKRLAIVVGLGGVGSLATGLVFGSLARGTWDEARALCGDDGICDNPATLADGNALVADARRQANLSTGLVIGGAALVGVGVVLWLTAPPTTSDTVVRIAPQIGPGLAAITLGGRFR